MFSETDTSLLLQVSDDGSVTAAADSNRHHPFLLTACSVFPPGWKGNLCERSLSSFVSLFILIPCTALAVYYLLLQTFVLRLEFLLSAVLLCFYSLEFLLGVISISAFSRSRVY
ncbi:hypothetical protein GOODEAATRI_032586 [Goodea atripinnis]|uniref:Transmembrane protein 216 n=1 Tax=Goodea atripinnis TaxID=208336 RepID=A0ABV0PJ14_9TELE